MLPQTVNIGCYKYEVIETDEPILVDGKECKGSIDYLLHQIKIKKSGLSDQQKEQTFWHEVVHGIINYRSFDPLKTDNEVTVDELAIGLYGLMKNNGILPGQTPELDLLTQKFVPKR